MPEEPGPSGEIAGQRELLSRLRAVVEAKDAENAVLRAERELRRRLELRLAELERRLSVDSSDSGTPSSKERIGAKQARRARQQSERERRGDRKRGGQPGHQGTGLQRDPDENKDAEPPAQCRQCGAGLDGAQAAGSRWAQVIDVEVIRKAAGWALPGLQCPCCGTVTFAEPLPGAHPGSVCYGAVLNAAAVVLTGYGNVPPGRAARVMAMLLGVTVSPGWVDKASGRLAAQLPRRSLTGPSPESYAASATRNPPSGQGYQPRRGITTASAYWHSLATLTRWCRIRSYPGSAAAHGITAPDAIRDALAGKPWLPPLPAVR